MNILTLTSQIDKDNMLSYMVNIDGVPVNGAFHTDPWDILILSTIVNTEFIDFNTCSCGVAGCAGYDSEEAFPDGRGNVKVVRANGDEFVFNQTQILQELRAKISAALTSNVWTSVWWDLMDWGDTINHHKYDVKLLSDAIDAALEKL
jgi:hypothetical protein